MKQLKNWKATGGCGIYAGMLRAGGAGSFLSFHTLLCSIRNTGIILTDWRRSVVVPIWKGKVDTQDCNNYRGYPPLCVRSRYEFSLIGSVKSC